MAAQASIEREIRIDASPDVVFPYFTEPEKMTRWKGREAKLEPTVGGVYRVEIKGENVALGEYVEIDPPRRVVFTWGWEGSADVPPGSSTVEITLTPDGDGTVVRLVHRDLPDEQAYAMHGEGWDHYLPRLQAAASGGDAGADLWADAAH